MDYLLNMKISKKRERRCVGPNCEELFLAKPGELFCRTCLAKTKKLDQKTYKLNFHQD